MSRIKFKEVSRFSDEFTRLQGFARSFDHVIQPAANGRVFEITRGDITVGYSDVLYVPVIFPAFHPGVTRPRDVVETITGWRRHCELSSAGEGLMGVPLAEERKTFPVEMLEKQGFVRMKREIYVLPAEG